MVVPPLAVLEIVTPPVEALTEIPVPAVTEVTPVVVIVSVPDEVIGLPEILIPVPFVAATEVTVPAPVPAPIAVRNVGASRADTVLSAFIRGKVIAEGLVRVKKLEPTVVAPMPVRAAA